MAAQTAHSRLQSARFLLPEESCLHGCWAGLTESPTGYVYGVGIRHHQAQQVQSVSGCLIRRTRNDTGIACGPRWLQQVSSETAHLSL